MALQQADEKIRQAALFAEQEQKNCKLLDEEIAAAIARNAQLTAEARRLEGELKRLKKYRDYLEKEEAEMREKSDMQSTQVHAQSLLTPPSPSAFLF